jgi:single-strand DNA-binding protein
MNNIRNRVQLVGNLGKDVELLSFDSGNKKAVITLATNEYYKNNKGEKVTDTQWHTIIAWGSLAELMASSLEKGNEVVVNGKLTQRSYDDKEGNKRFVTEVVAREFMRVTKKTTPF